MPLPNNPSWRGPTYRPSSGLPSPATVDRIYRFKKHSKLTGDVYFNIVSSTFGSEAKHPMLLSPARGRSLWGAKDAESEQGS